MIWLTVIVIGVGTYLMRLSFIAVVGQSGFPPHWERPLRYVAPAALAALAIQPILVREGSIQVAPDNLRLLAGLIAAGVAWKTKNIAATIVAGLGSLAILDWLF